MNATIENFIGVYEKAFPKEYCDSVIQYFENSLEAGLVANRQTIENVPKSVKDDENILSHQNVNLIYSGDLIKHFNKIFWEELYPHYANEFDVIKDFAPHANYVFKIQKTKIGGGYHVWHPEITKRENSSRLLSWILYLNDVDEGGETEFLYYPKRVKPETGKFIIWPGGFTHTHRGNPPLSNTKYIVTGFVEF